MEQYRIKFGTDLKTVFVVKLQRVNGDKAESAAGKVTKDDVVALYHAWGHALQTDTFLPSLAGTPSYYVSCAVEEGTGTITVQVSEKKTRALATNISAFEWRETHLLENPISTPGQTLQ